MAKKLKITESQLEKLMERKHSYTDNTPEGEMEEDVAAGAELAIINNPEEETEEVSLDDQILETLKKVHDFIMNQTEGGEENELCVEIMDLIEKLEPSEEEGEEESDEIPGFEGTKDDLNSLSINESIRANFRRFL
jgi:hypothetical protein